MTNSKTSLPGVLLLNPPLFEDNRGAFRPVFAERLHSSLPVPVTWAEMNFTRTEKNCLRGLHFQSPTPQAKLITVVSGSIFDVAVDLRHDSPTFGKFETFNLCAEGSDPSQIYLPPGFAHGFATPTGPATVTYLVSSPWAPDCEHVLAWDDPDLTIPWPLESPSLSDRDSKGLSWADILKKEL